MIDTDSEDYEEFVALAYRARDILLKNRCSAELVVSSKPGILLVLVPAPGSRSDRADLDYLNTVSQGAKNLMGF